MQRGAVCAEVGVWRGEFSERILAYTNPSRLHLIDPWVFRPDFPRRMYGGRIAKSQGDMDRIFKGVRDRFVDAPNVTVTRGASATVLPTFDDGYFDWVYIDGDHSYEAVLGDLRLCMRKVRAGGVIAGDDFTWNRGEGYPVARAVRAFVAQHCLEDNLTIIGSQFIIEKAR